MSTGVPYLGCKISLISKSEIRYEGILYTIDTKESTVALAKVRSYGTEDRPTDRPVAPRDATYEYIIFRGADIKDIWVCQPPIPQPTLEGGLPNDPAIVQHSATGPSTSEPKHASNGATGSSSAVGAPNKTPGAPSYGPIGSTSASAAYGGRTFTSSASVSSGLQGNGDGSPVMDLLREGVQSGDSTPAVGIQSGRSGSSGSGSRDGQGQGWRCGRQHSGGRGAGAIGTGRSGNRGNNYAAGNFRGVNRGGGGGGGRSFPPGRAPANKEKPLKFEDDYDFEQANEEFKECLEKLQKSSLSNEDGKEGGECPEANEYESGEISGAVVVDEDEELSRKTPCSTGAGGSEEVVAPVACYDKSKSFFDTISCDSLERNKGKVNRPNWKAEKKLNKETFGVAGNIARRSNFCGGANRGWNSYKDGGGSGGGGGGGYNNRGFNEGGGIGYNNSGYGYRRRNFWGGRGGGQTDSSSGMRGRGPGGHRGRAKEWGDVRNS